MIQTIVRGLTLLAVVLGTTHCARSTDFVFKMPEAGQEKTTGTEPGSLQGQVTDTRGNPIAGVNVVAHGGGGSNAGEATTDASGNYSIPGLAGAQYSVDYKSTSWHPITGVRIIVINERATIYNIVMTKRPGSVSGKVTDAGTAAPIAFVNVEVRTEATSPVVLASAITNADGNYSISGLSEGDYVVNFSVADYIPVNGVPLHVNGGRDTRLDQRMTSVFGTLRGKVSKASDGQALQGVKVSVRNGGILPITLDTLTDRNGNYSFPRLREGPYTVDFELQGYFPILDIATSISAGQTTILNQSMGSAGSGLRGRVTNALNGAPVFQATITVRSTDPNAPSTASTRTDVDGTYMFPGLAAGTYTVDFTKPAFFPILNVPVTLDPGRFTILDQSMSQELLDGEYRAVVTWTRQKIGAVRDVDSYLAIPNGRSYAIHFGNKIEDGSELDYDDTTWEGPETVTIHQMRMGTYTYYLNNYNNRCDVNALGNSEIIINLYSRAGLIKTYRVPPGRGINFEVFKIIDGQIVDSMRYNDSLRTEGGASCGD